MGRCTIAAKNPFAREAMASGKSVHLFLLCATPAAGAVEALGAMRRPKEDFALIGDALFLHTPDGLAGSKIAETIDRTLKVTTTARNWNTVAKLLDMADAR